MAKKVPKFFSNVAAMSLWILCAFGFPLDSFLDSLSGFIFWIPLLDSFFGFLFGFLFWIPLLDSLFGLLFGFLFWIPFFGFLSGFLFWIPFLDSFLDSFFMYTKTLLFGVSAGIIYFIQI